VARLARLCPADRWPARSPPARELTVHARQNGVKLPSRNTPYINTTSAAAGADAAARTSSARIRASCAGTPRPWSCARTRRKRDRRTHPTFAPAATLYEVRFQPFFRGRSEGIATTRRDLLQGHAAPGSTRALSGGRSTSRISRTPPRDQGRRRPLVVPAPWLMPDSGISTVSRDSAADAIFQRASCLPRGLAT